MATVQTPISPKVKAGANWAAYATLALTLLSTITPDMLAFLGPYAPAVYGLVVGVTYALGAYLKPDPLRDQSIPQPGAEATPLPAADVDPLPVADATPLPAAEPTPVPPAPQV